MIRGRSRMQRKEEEVRKNLRVLNGPDEGTVGVGGNVLGVEDAAVVDDLLLEVGETAGLVVGHAGHGVWGG